MFIISIIGDINITKCTILGNLLTNMSFFDHLQTIDTLNLLPVAVSLMFLERSLFELLPAVFARRLFVRLLVRLQFGF